MHRTTAALLACLLAAWSAARPDSVVSPRLDSGVTSSDGGGTRAFRNQPGVAVTTSVGPAR